MIQPPYGKPWLLFGILGGSLALNIAMLVSDGEMETGTESTAAGDSSIEVAPAPAAATQSAPAATPGATTPRPSSPMTSPLEPGWNTAASDIHHSLARTFQGSIGERGDAVAAVFARLFVWDLNLRRDLLAGDGVEVIWRDDSTGIVELAAARLHSGKHGRTFTAYRWHAPGDTFTSYWQEDGTEASKRLVNPPLHDYQQITALLKDGRNHHGMDFKVPVGTPVVSPYAGRVTRVDWNTHSNGNCVEVRFRDGVVAKFLHLSETQARVGQSVAAGEAIGLSGNTGRSTAPHLHYQLERGRKILDPVEYHGTVRRKLHASHMAAFHQEVARYDQAMTPALAMR